MHFKFKVTKEDLLAYQIYHLSHSKAIRFTMNIQRFLMPILFLVAPFVMKSKGFPFTVFMPLFTLSAIGWFFFYPRYFNWTMKRRTIRLFSGEDTEGEIGLRELAITHEGLTGKSKDTESSISWDKVQDVACTDRYIFFLIGAEKAAILPRRVFNSEIKYKEFLELIDGYRHS